MREVVTVLCKTSAEVAAAKTYWQGKKFSLTGGEQQYASARVFTDASNFSRWQGDGWNCWLLTFTSQAEAKPGRGHSF